MSCACEGLPPNQLVCSKCQEIAALRAELALLREWRDAEGHTVNEQIEAIRALRRRVEELEGVVRRAEQMTLVRPGTVQVWQHIWDSLHEMLRRALTPPEPSGSSPRTKVKHGFTSAQQVEPDQPETEPTR